MSPITSVSYHVHTPSLAEVQAVVPFDIDPTDPRTAAWYLLGIVYGRDAEKIWTGLHGPHQNGVGWASLDVRDPIVAVALSLSFKDYDELDASDLMRMFLHLDVEPMTAVLAAMLLYQHIDDGTWEPTVEARQAQEDARVAALQTAPVFDDSSERVED